MSTDIPLCRPSIGEDEIAAVVEVIESGWMAHGAYNEKFEHRFAELCSDAPWYSKRSRRSSRRGDDELVHLGA